MNSLTIFIAEINIFLHETFNEIDVWFDKEENIRLYKPKNGVWSIEQILEHIGLTSFYLLKLIEKGTLKALKNPNKAEIKEALSKYEYNKAKLENIGQHKSFAWIRPEHMEPLSKKTPNEVRAELKNQLQDCLNYLEKLKNGEGIMIKTTMTVNDLGKIDVYEYIYFLAQHAARHITQMQKNEAEYLEKVKM